MENINSDSINSSSSKLPHIDSDSQTTNEINKNQIKNESTIDKSKINNIMISILNNNTKDKPEVQEEEDHDPDIENEQSEQEENTETITAPNTGEIKSETIDRADFESIIDGYS